MSLVSAMYTGVSGLNSFGNAMNVIGDNIANVNTVGYKSNRANFADILANQVANGSTTMQFGRGTTVQNVSSSFQQGSFETTGNATDVGIQGAGFMVVRDPNVTNGTYYTRAGQFTLNDTGLLVNPNKYRVQGYALTTTATTSTVTRASASSDIDISGVQSVPKATTTFKFGVNLDTTAAIGTSAATSFNVYNAVGESTTVTYTFNKTAALTWDYVASASGATPSGTAMSGTVVFSSQGLVSTVNGSAVSADLSLTLGSFTSGAQSTTMSWDLFNSATSAQNNDMTSYASDSVTNAVTQDGYSTGVLRGLSVDNDGIISGLFSNGQTQQLYQLEMADFLSPWGLSRQGNSLYGETAQSGQPILGVANAGGFGSVLGSSLELSNVDLSQQFVDMIQNQRAYQANSRIVSTVDKMLQEVVNLVR